MENIENIQAEKLLSESELSQIEADYPEGMSAAEIVQVFTLRNIKFSEASFRKYVQLGLLPRSRRVGTKGKHKGSRGLYPAGTVRQINDIKRMMALDYTIEDISEQFAYVGGEIEELRRLLERIIDKLELSVREDDGNALLLSGGVRLRLADVRQTAAMLLQQLEAATRRIREQAQIARDAV